MSNSQTSVAESGAGSPVAPTDPTAPADSASERERIQRLVDQAANFNMFASPELNHSSPLIFNASRDGATGIRQRLSLQRLDIVMDSEGSEGVAAANEVGPLIGNVDFHWLIIPYDFQALPGRRSPATLLNPGITQRFVMQEAGFSFGSGADGFRGFGTGRTFPLGGTRPRLVAAAIGAILEGSGKFRGLEGNFTLCGELTADRGFSGHIMVRVVDPQGTLLTPSELPLGDPVEQYPDSNATYLTWMGHKGEGPDQENTFSIGPDGQVRGLNIPVQSVDVSVGFSVSTAGFQVSALKRGDIVGREVGFGRGSVPGASPSGGTFNPFLFEGVSLYSFYDREGNTVGMLTVNVLEGRRFDVKFPSAPDQPGLRFGFFGPVILGTGCFQGAQGFLYGASGSVFNMPPGLHVISNWYVLRLIDPEGRYRTS
jgi:hypothetical protein